MSGTSEIDRMRAKVAALEELLEEYEHTTILQAQKLESQSQVLLDAERARAEAAIERALRLQQEFAIAGQIQRSILPRILEVEGLDIAASMIPAEQVGGDYYDVIPDDDGCWLNIGDVSGHGLDAGLVMMMMQSVAFALASLRPRLRPRELFSALNATLYENLQRRLEKDDFVTFSTLRLERNGSLTFAGAHEDIVVLRKGAGSCEVIPTTGTWLGIKRNVESVTIERTLELAEGDILVLHTDGVTEAMNGAREEFGIHRLCEAVEASASLPVAAIRDAILRSVGAWAAVPRDDMTLLVLRYLRSEAQALRSA